MEKSILITFKGEIAMDNTTPVIDTKKNAAKFYKVVETYIKRDGINDLIPERIQVFLPQAMNMM